MSDYRQRKGLQAEEAAARYLKEKGFEILERRYRSGHKEIDLIVQKKDLVVFVEVKARGNETYGPVALSIPPWKRNNLIQVAHAFLGEKGTGGPERQYRFDVVFFHPPDADGKIRLEHITDAFRP